MLENSFRQKKVAKKQILSNRNFIRCDLTHFIHRLFGNHRLATLDQTSAVQIDVGIPA